MGRQSHRSVGLCLAIWLATAGLPSPVAGAEQGRLRADLDGQPIRPAEAGSYYCHDFAYPTIHCFTSAEALDAALGGATGSLSTSAVAAAYGPSDYVTIYSGASYSGSFAHLAQSYDALAWIGWNDIISSFKGRNSRSGVFREHWFAGGAAYSFCCNQNVPSLPAGVDNTFSSVYRT